MLGNEVKITMNMKFFFCNTQRRNFFYRRKKKKNNVSIRNPMNKMKFIRCLCILRLRMLFFFSQYEKMIW